MTLTGQTRVVGIFGDPVAHSLSPLMQNAALQSAGIDAVYVPFHVTPAQLRDAVHAIRSLGLVGANLTIPHKEAACELVDEIDPVAARIGAINTIVHRDGRLLGFNTDAPGLLHALEEDLGFTATGKKVLVTGAGGAARAAVVALARAGAAWIGVANRSLERAEELVAGLSPQLTGTAFAVLPFGEELPGHLEDRVDLLVNSTAVGLKGEVFPLPLSQCVRSGGAVYDMVYGREPTSLTVAARHVGLLAADGLGMLAGQGEEAFRLWFGVPAPQGMMRAVLNRLRGEK